LFCVWFRLTRFLNQKEGFQLGLIKLFYEAETLKVDEQFHSQWNQQLQLQVWFYLGIVIHFFGGQFLWYPVLINLRL
jgi:hypothetical protein